MYKSPTERTIAQILKKEDKYIDEVKNTPGHFIRKILAFNRVTMDQLNRKVDAWTAAKYAPNDKLRSSAKSNILKALAGNEPTWNTFIRLLDIMNYKEVTMTLQMLNAQGSVEFQQHTVVNDYVRPESEGGDSNNVGVDQTVHNQ